MPSRRALLTLPACLYATPGLEVAIIVRQRILTAANHYLKERPLTVTASSSPRSAGSEHDFFSEGDYWRPDPANPSGPYVQRDGMTNPDNFLDHRRAMVRLSLHVPALTAAFPHHPGPPVRRPRRATSKPGSSMRPAV